LNVRSDNMGAWTALRSVRSGDRTALICGGVRLTYAELDERCARAAGGLVSRGIKPGDRVAVVLRNRTEFIELMFATTRCGAIFVPINFRLSEGEIAYVLRDSGARLVLGQEALSDRARPAVERLDIPFISVDGPDGEYSSWMESGLSDVAPVPVDRDSPAMIIYTSGTTGPAKGAIITHENVLFNVVNYLGDWDLRADDITLVVNPIFHVVLHILTVPLLYQGGTVVLMEEYEPQEALRIIGDERVTVMFAIPTAWQMLADAPAFATADLSRLRFIGSGGAACPVRLMNQFAERGIAYRQGYGLTETTSSGAVMDARDQARKPGSIGRPFFGVEARIVGDDGQFCATGEHGELQLRGRNIARGYWNKPDETSASFLADGWFRTGDIAYADPEGFLYLVDRKKDIIITGGENVASIEVEQALLAHPGIAEAAVIGVPHERWGETPRAIVAPRVGFSLDEEQVIEHCRGVIAHYKCPTTVVVLPELPKTATGKIAKAELRQTFGVGVVAAGIGR
jgi:fatty-acyl-CoA synthase